ncbi:unnamed protein product [Moneuplotes crassus]|uniref:Small EDRK-rich factor-like N-terminal domain-containing protein n=1 Tax=Euplotes crassus TaxID=5936 RepID=A0AAD1Y403_EUPCR|nr:unnamed protein product [Moneuplotes crassus]|eukprot:CAMPEP_0197005310 /NCGR_PEP_ID=MMETSP1380-20130617/28701_1 /TAXON_ID=5936 /ORGANISM="Euplotes crassus, Strain CT5" /LENGTH=111 /DNA_ID=CAMNT_0042424403 /DNA_START=6 /DNA_END=341 /DNA_ORIENTATION=+
MARGNQREIDRERAMKRKDKKKIKTTKSGFEKRKEDDAERMREKQRLAEERKLKEAEEEKKELASEPVKPKKDKKKAKAKVPNFLLGFTGGHDELKAKKKAKKELQKKKGK